MSYKLDETGNRKCSEGGFIERVRPTSVVLREHIPVTVHKSAGAPSSYQIPAPRTQAMQDRASCQIEASAPFVQHCVCSSHVVLLCCPTMDDLLAAISYRFLPTDHNCPREQDCGVMSNISMRRHQPIFCMQARSAISRISNHILVFRRANRNV